MTPRRLEPVALIAVVLAVVALATYLWLVEQKGDGKFEPAVWFLVLVVVAVITVGLTAVGAVPLRLVLAASAGALLVVLGALTPLTMDTSHVAAMLGSVGLLLVAAGCAGITATASTPAGRVRVLTAAAVAVLAVAVAMPAASYLASHGEGIGGGSGGGAEAE